MSDIWKNAMSTHSVSRKLKYWIWIKEEEPKLACFFVNWPRAINWYITVKSPTNKNWKRSFFHLPVQEHSDDDVVQEKHPSFSIILDLGKYAASVGLVKHVSGKFVLAGCLSFICHIVWRSRLALLKWTVALFGLMQIDSFSPPIAILTLIVYCNDGIFCHLPLAILCY